MVDLRISSQAERDLDDIAAWETDDFGEQVAASHIAGFERFFFALLRAHPLVGEARPAWGWGIRTVSHPPHRLLYRVDARGVLIVRVVHMSRDVRRALRSAE